MEALEREVIPDLTRYSPVGDWREQFGGAFFPTQSSIDWFIKTHRDELIKSVARSLRVRAVTAPCFRRSSSRVRSSTFIGAPLWARRADARRVDETALTQRL